VSNMPFGNLPPSLVNLSGFLKYSTTSCNSPLHSSQPRTSLNVFLFFSGIVSLSYCFGANEGVVESPFSSSSLFFMPLEELVGGYNEDDDEDDDDDDDDDLFVKEDARESIERLISPKKKSNNGNRKREDLLLLHNDDDDDDDLNNELKDERRGDDNKSNRSPSTSIGGSKKALVEKYNALLSRFRALRRDFLKLSSDYDYNYALFAERDKELDELDILLKQEFRKTKRLKERVKSLELEIALTRQA